MKKHQRAGDDWFRPRGYLHFDKPLGQSCRQQVENFVQNTKLVARHGFFPFISYDRTKYKIVTADERGTRYLDDKGVRTLSYAAHKDAQIYAYYGSKLSALYENELKRLGLENSVIAFRRLKDKETGAAKSNIHFARDAFDLIRSVGECSVHTFDVKGFFDNLRADDLKRAWSQLLGADRLPDDHFAIFRSVTKHAVVDRDALYKALNLSRSASRRTMVTLCDGETFRRIVRGSALEVDPKTGFERRGLIVTKNKGIPQGSPISGLLANVYMLNFDSVVNNKVTSLGGVYFRYCDDLFFLLPSGFEFKLEEFVAQELSRIGLWLNTAKTDHALFSIQDGRLKSDKAIQYLGFTFDGEQTCIRPGSLSRYCRKLKAAVRLARATQRKHNTIREKKGLKPTPLFRKEIFEKYSHTGKSNFITYGLRAAKIMRSPTIRRQIKKMGMVLDRELRGNLI